jgi:hypothetical protein
LAWVIFSRLDLVSSAVAASLVASRWTASTATWPDAVAAVIDFPAASLWAAVETARW